MTLTFNRLRRALISGIAALAILPVQAFAFDDAQKAEIGEIVKQYLLDNPEIIIEVQQALEAKQEEANRERRKEIISQVADDVFKNPADPVLGNPAGDVTVVEFFDYNCGFCKRAVADMNGMLDADPKIKFVLKEFPIFGENSIKVHTVAVAFNRLMPAKYNDYHMKLFSLDERVDEAAAIAAALELGVDEAKLREEMADPQIQVELENTQFIANALGITGTPSYIVGDEVIVGALGREVLEEKVANMRSCESTIC